MNSFFSEVFLDKTFVLLLFTTTYVILAYWFFRSSRARRQQRASSLFEAVTKGLQSGVLVSLDDVVNLYKGIFGLPSDDLAYRSGLSSFLRDYLVRLVSGRTGPDSEDALPEWKGRVTNWLEQNEGSAPFADLPEVERHLIADISEFVDSNNIEGVKRKLDQLASSITVRQQDYQRIQEMNRWSVPLAAVGALLTVFFGILTVLR